jgi:hypothetical protein
MLHFKLDGSAQRSWVSGLVCLLAKCKAVTLVGGALLAALPVSIPVVLSSSRAVAREGGGSGGGSTTPAGICSIPVTLPSTGISHVVTLTMTLD